MYHSLGNKPIHLQLPTENSDDARSPLGVTPLPAKRRRFVEEYLVDLNAAQAAIRAGYSAKTARSQGQRLLTIVDVQAAIKAEQDALSARTAITQEYVVSTLAEVVERCMQRAPVMVKRDRVFVQAVDEDGNHLWTFNATGATAAVQLLGKHLGMFTDKHDHRFPDGVPVAGVLAVPVPIASAQWAMLATKQQTELLANPPKPQALVS